MLNTCVIIGNLGNDPEIFYNSEGQPVANFNFAFRAGKKKTGWIRVTAFNKLAEITEGEGVASRLSTMKDRDLIVRSDNRLTHRLKASPGSCPYAYVTLGGGV